MPDSAPRKVLYIDYFFPPLEADWRAIAFAKHLPELGWQPVVVSADGSVSSGKDHSTLLGIPAATPVHRVGHRERSRTWSYARLMLRIAADFPDEYASWYGPALRQARSILQREKIDLIYSASPAFTTAMIALALKREFGLPWVADFLDGWAVNDFLLDHIERHVLPPLRQLLLWRIRRAERAILTTADRVVSIHPHVVERWKELHRIGGENVRVVTDGYEEDLFAALTPRPLSRASPRITFLGSYYAQFHDTIREFLSAVREVAPDAEVIFVGRNVEAVHRMGMPNVTCVLNVPRVRALEYGLGSDFLYVVMPPFGRWTPTKTYDYLRLGKPILGSLPEDGDAAAHLRAARAGYVLPYASGPLKAVLADVFAQHKSGGLAGFAPDPTYVARFERRQLAREMADVFESALSARR